MKWTVFLLATSCPFGSVTPAGKRARYTAVSAPVRINVTTSDESRTRQRVRKGKATMNGLCFCIGNQTKKHNIELRCFQTASTCLTQHVLKLTCP